MNSKSDANEMFYLFNRYRGVVEKKIREYRGSKTKKAGWMERELPSIYRKFTPREGEERGWFWQILCQAHHFRYYDSQDNKQREDVRSAYKGMLHPKKKIPNSVLSIMTELGFPVFSDGDYHERNSIPDMDILPPYSCFLRFQFELEKPYISRDDTNFYIIDNPIKKEHVFKVPFIAASSWKGNLRWVMMRKRLGEWWESLDKADQETKPNIQTFAQRRYQLTLLFGNENKAYQEYLDDLSEKAVEEHQSLLKTRANKEGLLSGRLYFYPTFFDQMRLEVINPHDRKKKAGTSPILIESVPAGTKGIFSLLYVPFDLIGQGEDVKKEIAGDLELLPGALKSLMQTYGFSAKRTSGYGVVKDEILPEVWMSNWQKDLKQVQNQISQSDDTPKEFTSFADMKAMIKQFVNTLEV